MSRAARGRVGLNSAETGRTRACVLRHSERCRAEEARTHTLTSVRLRRHGTTPPLSRQTALTPMRVRSRHRVSRSTFVPTARLSRPVALGHDRVGLPPAHDALHLGRPVVPSPSFQLFMAVPLHPLLRINTRNTLYHGSSSPCQVHPSAPLPRSCEGCRGRLGDRRQDRGKCDVWLYLDGEG